jgi:hypothetical protein
MNEQAALPAWIQQAKAHGWAGALRVALDGLAPLGILGAQAVLIFQPSLSVFVPRQALTELAEALETPQGIAALRAALADDAAPDPADSDFHAPSP